MASRPSHAPRSIRPTLAAAVLALLASSPAVVPAQQPAPTPTASSIYDGLPPERDPRNPYLSREERMRLQEELIRERIQRGEERRQQEAREAAERQRQEALAEANRRQQQQTAPPTQDARPQDVRPPRPTAQPSATRSEVRPATPGNLPFVTFHLDPATVVANVGETFITRTGLINNDRLIIDAVRIALSYPPTIMRPVAIDDAELRRLLKGDPDVRLDTVSGHIVYEGELAKPTVGAELALIAIEWEALRPAQQAPIRTSVDNAHSGALQEGRLISTTSLGPQNAQLGTSVRIRPAETGLPDGMEFYRETVQTFEPEIFDASREASRLPRLWIDQPSEGTFQPGDYLVIDLGISNPDGLPIDEIRLAGRFDPNAVEILDTDTNNWIVRGANLLDGPFKSLWPWDLHYNNTVNNQAGIFYYWMGAFNPIVHESAPVARLFVRIKAPTEAPLIEWIWRSGTGVDQPHTGLYAMNQNLYQQHLAPEQLPGRSAPVMDAASLAPDYERADPSVYRF